MKNILLICSAGMTTSFLVEKMKKVAEQENHDVHIEATSDSNSDSFVGKVDAVLLGPQVKFLEEKTKEKFTGVPVAVINMMDYGTMNGEKVLKQALDLIK